MLAKRFESRSSKRQLSHAVQDVYPDKDITIA